MIKPLFSLSCKATYALCIAIFSSAIMQSYNHTCASCLAYLGLPNVTVNNLLNPPVTCLVKTQASSLTMPVENVEISWNGNHLKLCFKVHCNCVSFNNSPSSSSRYSAYQFMIL